MHQAIGSIMFEDAAPRQLHDPFDAIVKTPSRADVLGIQLATLRQIMTRHFVLIDQDDPFDAESSGHGTIVVAHEHRAIQSIMAEMLGGLGYRVVIADSRMADMPKDLGVDAILLDVPMISDEHLARIRSVAQRVRRVVAMTSLPAGSARQRLRVAGVAGFVAWPLDRREVGRCLRTLLIDERP